LLLLISNLEIHATGEDKVFEKILSDIGIVNMQQIKVPGYPNAFNPSLIPYKEGYLLSFRFRTRGPEVMDNQFRMDLSFVGLARLNQQFKVSERSVQLLNIASYCPKFSLTAEDARLLKVGNRIFLFFNDVSLSQEPGQFALYFGEIVEERGLFALKEPAKFLHYSSATPIEKNWSPFVSGERLYVIYSDDPRIILEVDLNTGHCQEVARAISHNQWNYGEIRGGTPAYLIGDTFLTFFHSSFQAKIPKKRAYVMGAYTFDADPPFSIRKMTPLPLGKLADYAEENAAKVVFPGGLVIEDRQVHVSWGKGDKQIWVTTFDRDKLLSSMEICPD
jgi:predicted GH43/DUF377 family glycosyl hydrolase